MLNIFEISPINEKEVRSVRRCLLRAACMLKMVENLTGGDCRKSRDPEIAEFMTLFDETLGRKEEEVSSE